MTMLRCTVCGSEIRARSRFEAGGDCPECGADEGCLVEEDAYDPETRELRCAECGWEIAAGVQIDWEGDVRVFTVDDDCPMCAAAGFPGQALEPADAVRAPRDEPEYGTARAAARRVRDGTVGPRVPVDVEAIARALQLRVRRGPFDHDGLLRGTTIEVPQRGHTPERFVIAHEMGHYELRHEGDRAKVEPEANAFASELLIPRSELVCRVGKDATLRGLARQFDVSREAIVYALRSAKLLNRLGR